jgi:hypothetical protein
MRRYIWMAIGLCCITACAVVLPGGALAGQSGARTTVTINDRCSFECRSAGAGATRNYVAHFYGRVSSDEAKCERGRKVILMRKGKPTEGFQAIAKTTSQRDGDWKIELDNKPGFTDYVAKVKEIRKAQLRCLGATSDRESHDPPE